MSRRMTAVLLASCFLLVFPSSLSAGLSTFDYRIIKIAFMNGYIQAIENTDQDIQILRENRTILEQVVKGEVERYMTKVSEMNKVVPSTAPRSASTEMLRRNTNW